MWTELLAAFGEVGGTYSFPFMPRLTIFKSYFLFTWPPQAQIATAFGVEICGGYPRKYSARLLESHELICPSGIRTRPDK